MNNFYGSIRNNFYPSHTGNQEMISTEEAKMIISMEEALQAIGRWKEVTGLSHQHFWNWVEGNTSPGVILEATGAEQSKLEIFLSPHYKTLFKIYQIQHSMEVFDI
jgi:hypothetical protein